MNSAGKFRVSRPRSCDAADDLLPILTEKSASSLDGKVGDRACALIKAFHIILVSNSAAAVACGGYPPTLSAGSGPPKRRSEILIDCRAMRSQRM
jgi:hypothetical protein